jgi:hypothetical protein
MFYSCNGMGFNINIPLHMYIYYIYLYCNVYPVACRDFIYWGSGWSIFRCLKYFVDHIFYLCPFYLTIVLSVLEFQPLITPFCLFISLWVLTLPLSAGTWRTSSRGIWTVDSTRSNISNFEITISAADGVVITLIWYPQTFLIKLNTPSNYIGLALSTYFNRI